MTKKPDGTWDKSRLPSRHVTEGPARAPHRSYYYAMGLGTREIAQPFVGVASCWNEAAPCNTALMRQAHAVSAQGVKAAGATPREFCTITVTDGIAMGHEGMRSSPGQPRGDRRLGRADHARPRLRRPGRRRRLRQAPAGHDDGHAAAERARGVPLRRLDPARPLAGPRRHRGRRVRRRRQALGRQDRACEDLCDLEQHACPGDGACGGQFTANTMACVSEAIGLALPLSAALPAPYREPRRSTPWPRARRWCG